MPAVEKDKEGYTALDRAFIRCFVLNGGMKEAAAIEAGFAPTGARTRAYELLAKPRIIEGIAKYRRDNYQAMACMGQKWLNDLMKDSSVQASVKKDIAFGLIDRAGDKHAEKHEDVTHQTPAEKANRYNELTDKMADVILLKAVDKDE